MIKDNHKRGNIGDFLKEKIKSDSKLSFVSAYFTIYAYHALKEQLNSVDHLRFLFGEPRFVSSLDLLKRRTRRHSTLKMPNFNLITVWNRKQLRLSVPNGSKKKWIFGQLGSLAFFTAKCITLDWFDMETAHGRDMTKYNELLRKAVNSIVQSYRKKLSLGLQAGRNFILPDSTRQVNEQDDFELITWLVIK